MNEDQIQLQLETEILVKLMREHKGDGDARLSLSLEDVPAEIGGYGLYDGLRCWGGGSTYNMRRSLEELARNRGPLKRPIYSWTPDTDGSTALWLDNKVRCSLCKPPTVINVFIAEEHRFEVHGIKKPCECDD
jgi:hypothetical protein